MYWPCDSPGTELSAEERQKQQVRGLFWLCYTLDKDISLVSGRPPVLAEDYCDLTHPSEGETPHMLAFNSNREPTMEDSSIYGGRSGEKSIFFGHVLSDLGMLKERIYRLLYSARSIHREVGEHLLYIRELDVELETWRMSISPDIRPTLAIPQQYSAPAAELRGETKMLRVTLQLEYHYLIILLHATARRCRYTHLGTRRTRDDLHSVLHSSTDLCLEASRSTLSILRQHVDTMLPDGIR